ncbi:hypothetical protein R3P38DRAFT_3350717 [Favolaschia claudopus]|uniref:Uncharacterized protein n=1 Tax=Favolaschia claudopus TaxID=2862362 RepID=A0AAW0C849_9AGAR
MTRLPAPRSGIAVQRHHLRTSLGPWRPRARLGSQNRSRNPLEKLLDKRAGLVRRVASSSPRLPQPHRIIACKPRSFKGTIQIIRIQPFPSCSETGSAVPQIAATWYEAEVHRRGFARLGGVGGEVALGIRIADWVVF